MIKSLSTGADRIRSWLSGASSTSADEQPNVSRRMFLTGAAAVACTVVIAGMPGEAEAQYHNRYRSGNQHSRRRSGYYNSHDRYRSNRARHNAYRSGPGWGGAPGCYVGPLWVSPCPF